MLSLAAVIVWQGFGRSAGPVSRQALNQPLPKDPIKLGTAPVRGSRSAAVAIVEFADFECPACADFTKEIEPAIVRDYVDKGRVAFVFKNYPLLSHRRAKGLAAAGWCAGQQGMFWQAHDWLYGQRADQDLPAAEFGLDLPRYNACLTGSAPSENVEADRREGEALQLKATPTFFFGKLTPDGFVEVSDVDVGVGTVQTFKVKVERLLGPPTGSRGRGRASPPGAGQQPQRP